MLAVLTDSLADRPATLAFFAVSFCYANLKLRTVILDLKLGYDKRVLELQTGFFEEVKL